MSWMRSGKELSQFLRDFLPTLVLKIERYVIYGLTVHLTVFQLFKYDREMNEYKYNTELSIAVAHFCIKLY